MQTNLFIATNEMYCSFYYTPLHTRTHSYLPDAPNRTLISRWQFVLWCTKWTRSSLATVYSLLLIFIKVQYHATEECLLVATITFCAGEECFWRWRQTCFALEINTFCYRQTLWWLDRAVWVRPDYTCQARNTWRKSKNENIILVWRQFLRRSSPVLAPTDAAQN